MPVGMLFLTSSKHTQVCQVTGLTRVASKQQMAVLNDGVLESVARTCFPLNETKFPVSCPVVSLLTQMGSSESELADCCKGEWVRKSFSNRGMSRP